MTYLLNALNEVRKNKVEKNNEDTKAFEQTYEELTGRSCVGRYDPSKTIPADGWYVLNEHAHLIPAEESTSFHPPFAPLPSTETEEKPTRWGHVVGLLILAVFAAFLLYFLTKM